MTGQKILRLEEINADEVERLLNAYGLKLQIGTPGDSIPGTFWGEPEAGLIGNRLFARPDTPLHSILHEACHFICMDVRRRTNLHTNAGGDFDEENAVCYLQILLADRIAGFGRHRCMEDMDAWGYSFRLGSARAWFERDADDALEWLERRGLLPRLGSTGK